MAGFSLADSLKAQKAMRDELRLAEAVFEVPQFVGMVSDEIEQLRAKGWNDQKIAELTTKATGQTVETAAIGRHYVEPADRQAQDGHGNTINASGGLRRPHFWSKPLRNGILL